MCIIYNPSTFWFQQYHRPQELRIMDLETKSGTRVEGRRILDEALSTGNRITVGTFVLRVVSYTATKLPLGAPVPQSPWQRQGRNLMDAVKFFRGYDYTTYAIEFGPRRVVTEEIDMGQVFLASPKPLPA